MIYAQYVLLYLIIITKPFYMGSTNACSAAVVTESSSSPFLIVVKT